MALLHFDGFDTYGIIPTSSVAAGVISDVPLQAAGYTGTATSDVAYSVSFQNIGRPRSSFDPTLSGRACFAALNGSRANSWYYDPFGSLVRKVTTTGNQLIVGFKLGWPTQFPSAAYQQMVRMWFGNYSFDVAIANPLQTGQTGTVQIYRHGGPMTTSNVETVAMTTGSAISVIGQSNFNMNLMNTVEVAFDKTTGIVTVWINNSFVGSATLTTNAASDLGAGIMFAEITNFAAVSGVARWPGYVTDLYIVDNTGAAPTSRLGKVKVVTRVPTGDAAVTWNKPGAAPTNASVAATIPPTSGNYLSGVAVGDTDLYSAGAFNFSNEAIIATAVVTSGYKTDVTGNDLAATLKIGATVYEGAKVTLPVSATFKTTQTIFTLNPATGLKFTKAELDAANFGMRVKDPAS